MHWKITPLFLLLSVAIAASGSAPRNDAIHTERILFNENGALYVMDRNGGNRQRLAESVRAAALSSDGNLAAYADKGTVTVISIADEKSVIVTNIKKGMVDGVAWSPDGKKLAYDAVIPGESENLYIAAYPNGSAPRNLGHWYGGISFSPDGQFILHAGWRPAPQQSGNTLEIANVETGKREELYASNDFIEEPRYSPDGSYIAFRMTSLENTTSSASDDEPDCLGPDYDLWVLAKSSRTPVKIMESVYDFDWSPDGHSLAASTGSQECDYPPPDAAVFFSSIDKKVQFKVSRESPAARPIFSPDGKGIMFTDFNKSRLMIYDLETRSLAQVGAAKPIVYDRVYDWK